MEIEEMKEQPELILRPSAIYAFMHVLPLLMVAILFLLVAWWLYYGLIWLSFVTSLVVWYRFMYTWNILYFITPQFIRIRTGLFSKRLDNLEMYRIKDYVKTQSFIFQLFHLMNLTLKTTDPENKTIVLTGIPVSDIVDTIRDHVQEARLKNKIIELN